MTFRELSDYNDVMLQEGPFASRLAALGLGAASLFSGPGDVQAKMPAPIARTIKQDQSLYDYIVQSEGKGKKDRPGYAYRDHKGYLTVGVGHLVLRNDPILKKVIGKNYSAVISGQVPLNDSQMKQLFDYDVQSKIKLAKSKVKNFDKLPTAVQNAIVDGFFRQAHFFRWSSVSTRNAKFCTFQQLVWSFPFKFEVFVETKRFISLLKKNSNN